MLRGEKVGLRARRAEDVPILHEDLYEDVATRSRADSRPWRPIAAGSAASPYAVADPSDDAAVFSVVDLDDDELAGEALLWGLDLHHRCAHIGVSLRPTYRGRGFGTDVVHVLCAYAFETRGLHRVQVDTLAHNSAMISAATRVGFSAEGTLRKAAWVNGEFADELLLGLLVNEWSPR
ncbi:MAG: GNAT family N-acetyltransferase [Nocardioidaceae bacterium]